MLPKADLHIHTVCSDGKLQPKEAVQLAKKKKLVSLSITDHDTYAGYFEAKEEADKLDIELIPGVEITASFGEKEVHILAYYFEPEIPSLQNLLAAQRRFRKDRIKGIIDTVNKKGIDVQYDEVWAEANGANIGRPHLARVLKQKGYVHNTKEAFIRYLSNQKLGTIENNYPDFKEVIETVKSAGGACIIAHPGKFFNTDELNTFVDAGIDGFECIHPSHNYALQKKYTEYCSSKALLMTGGSDSHVGIDAGYTNVGVVTIAYKHIEKMKRMTEQRKQIADIKI